MSPQPLRPISWLKFEKFVLDQGYEFKRQKGSHRVYSKPEVLRPVIIPAHTFDIPISVIANNLRTMGIPTEEYSKYMATHKKKRRPR